MTDVLRVTALEIGDPVALFVLVEGTDPGLWHPHRG